MADIQLIIDVVGQEDMVRAARAANRMTNEYKALDRAFNSGKMTAQQYATGIQQVDARVYAMSMAIQQSSRVLKAQEVAVKSATVANHVYGQSAGIVGKRTNRMGVLFQQTGYQVGDFAVQVQSGTNVMVALGQQATQLVGTFGMLAKTTKGIAFFAALGIIVPIATAVAGGFMRAQEGAEGTSEAVKQLKDQLSTISPVLDPIANAFSGIKDATIDFANLVINNLDRVVSYVITAAGVFGITLVKGIIAARVATLSLASAMVTLRTAIIKTGVGALVIASGELVFQFTRLTKAAGGFGVSIGLLKDVAVEFFFNIPAYIKLIPDAMSFAASAMKSFFADAILDMTIKFQDFTWSVASGLNNLFGTNLTGARLVNTSFGVEDPLIAAATAAQAELTKTRIALEDAMSAANIPTDALDKLKSLLESMSDSKIDIRDLFGGAGGAGEDGDGAGGVLGQLTEMQKRIQSIADTIKSSMSEAFMSMVDGTKTAKDAFKDMARAIIKQLYDVLVVQQLVGSFDAQTKTGSGIVGAIMGAFQANGGAWSGGRQIEAYANGGVVGGPTYFPMASGKTGLMGEAGPEAIMPLKRGSDGKLGVSVEGGSGAVNVTNNINVTGGSDPAAIRMEVAKLMPQITSATKSAVIDARRRGGQMKAAFG